MSTDNFKELEKNEETNLKECKDNKIYSIEKILNVESNVPEIKRTNKIRN